MGSVPTSTLAQLPAPSLGNEDVPTTTTFNWGFEMPDGSQFTNDRWTPLRDAAELFLLSLRNDPPEGRMPLRKGTIGGHFSHIRFLVRWMAAENVRCFRDLDRDTVDQFVEMLRARPGRNGALLSLSTAEGHLGTIRTFHMQSDKLEDAPLMAPPRVAAIGKRHWKPYGGHPYTPDEIVVPLISGAIELLGEPANQILALRDRLEDLYERLQPRHQGRRLHWHIRRAMLAEPCPCSDRYPNPEWPLRRLAFMLDRLGDACFVVIAYLVGARASEILGLQEGCLERRAADGDGEDYVYLVGTITKTSRTEHGDIHRWLAPEPVQRAIHILERLSAPLRELSGMRYLWLHQLGYGRSPLPTKMPVGQLTSSMVNVRMNERLAPFLALPDHRGDTWRLTTYQGRKTFSRFIGRRDRTGLTALQRHLGHVHRAMTDRAYVGTDFELAELIDDQTAEETRKALEDLLLAPYVAGKAGIMLSERSPFRGRTRPGDVDVYITEILAETDSDAVIAELGDAIFRDPETGSWQTEDAYLSGQVRDKLKAAEAAAALDPVFERNVRALVDVQPADLGPSDITARLGAPWIPAADIVAFVKETIGAEIKIHHMPELASWTVQARQLGWMAAGTSEWGTERRHAGELIADALNSRVPQIFDIVKEGDSERRVLNVVDTEAAKEKLSKIKTAFQIWIWSDPDRTDRLARVYNDRFNNIAPRKFNGDHLQLPGACSALSLYGHQKRGIWRIISAGSTYLAHAVGAGKTMTMAAAVMEQKRLGLIAKAMMVVPGHCLAQAAREFLALYPTARILVADETNFSKDKRHRFLSRAATSTWDAIIITHSAFRFIDVPSAFEQQMIGDELELYETLLTKVESDDRVSRKRLERLKEGLKERLESLSTRKDDLLTISELGIDQIIVDEAQEFRKLSFATNMSTLKGIDPNGSQRAWDLYVKSRFVETKNPGRALVLASGTPITNTLGEMFSVQRYLGFEALHQRGLHEFDAWASTFGDVTTELELQPNGKNKPVTRFATFVNVPELIAMFRSFADVVMPEDLRAYVRIPALSTGARQIRTSKPSAAFKRYQTVLDARIKAIEQREGPPQPGDDILLSVITDGRHAAIDLRLVDPDNDNERDNKLNDLVGNAYRIWQETNDATYVRPDGKAFELPGAAQMIFSDLGTISVEKSRGFSAYRWIRDELIRMGVPASEIAFMQDFKKSEAKQRLFGDVRAGKVRFLIGSSETMGTGVNAQLRLKALHHLDVPWLPSQIEQREGRIQRQGNQHDVVDIFAYATEGSMDAQMWQNNERKARFIAAALSGDTSIRRLEDMGEGQANQFAMAKAIASGDPRLMQKAGLEADIARLERLRAAHQDDQFAIRRQIRDAERDIEHATRRITEIGQDIIRLVPTAGDAFRMGVGDESFVERKLAGRAVMKEILTLVQLQQEGDSTIASIGGFDLDYSGERFGKDGYRYTTMLMRTGADHEIDLSVTTTPLGAIARLEHAVSGFEGDLERCRHRLSDAEHRLVSYRSRQGGDFAFSDELADKRRQLGEIEASLSADVEGVRTSGILKAA